MVAKSEENKQTENLSAVIDAINKGEHPVLADAEARQLAEVALLLKQSGPPPAIIDDITARLRKEAAVAKKKRRWWLMSGTAGIAAASLLVFALSLQPQRLPPEAPLTLPPAGGIVIERLPESPPQAKQDAPPNQGVSAAGPDAEKSYSAGGPATGGADGGAARKKTVAAASEPPSERGTVSLALTGRDPDRVTVDKRSGAVRRVYGIGGREVVVTQKPSDKAAPPEGREYALMAAPGAADGQPAAKAGQTRGAVKVNKVTRTINGMEVTVEGEQSEEDLAKIADELVEKDKQAAEKE